MLSSRQSAYVLGRINEIMSKMKQASDTLQELYVQTELDKKQVVLGDHLRPLTINIEKAFKVIS